MERHKDLKIEPSKNNYPKGSIYLYDLALDEDLSLVDKKEAVKNGVIVAILTHYNELSRLPLYKGFGSKIHELIKQNMDTLTLFKLEQYLKESVSNMSRVQSVDELKIKTNEKGQVFMSLKLTDISGNLEKMEEYL